MITKIPFAFLSTKKMVKLARPFMGLAGVLEKFFPGLLKQLTESEINLKPREYLATAVFLLFFYFILFTALAIGIFYSVDPELGAKVGAVVALVVALFIFTNLLLYPKSASRKRVRNIDSNLVFALRTILVQVKSGVSLFDAIKMVSRKEYGYISKEFKSIAEKISSGEIEEGVLKEAATTNPSKYYKKAMWQIINGMKAGGDIADIMQEIVRSIIQDERIEIEKYGGQLRLLSLVYMMLGIIIPALGVTFLIVLSSFPQINITEIVFWTLLGFVVLFQFMYLGVVKTKRPTLVK